VLLLIALVRFGPRRRQGWICVPGVHLPPAISTLDRPPDDRGDRDQARNRWRQVLRLFE
jgi:hypothetical protein